MPRTQKVLYLTFDDGPHPAATSFVLEQLSKYNAQATFFCIGKNVQEHPVIYQQIVKEGHSVGNHTHNHLNGWKTDNAEYLENISTAAKLIHSNLFRPPYGRITLTQSKELRQVKNLPHKIIMWDVLSADFDETINGKQCLKNVIQHATHGSIIVFHDSAKALPRLQYALPRVLAYYARKGYSFSPL